MDNEFKKLVEMFHMEALNEEAIEEENLEEANEELDADVIMSLRKLHNMHGPKWKSYLLQAWRDGNYHGIGIHNHDDRANLQYLRNTKGQSFLKKFQFKETTTAGGIATGGMINEKFHGLENDRLQYKSDLGVVVPITAVFTDVEEANVYMENHKDEGVLAEINGVILVAKN